MKLLSFTSLVLLLVGSDAFPSHRSHAFNARKTLVPPVTFRPSPIYFFGRENKDTDTNESDAGEKKRSIPFFGRLKQKVEQKSDASIQKNETGEPPVVTKRLNTVNPPILLQQQQPEDPVEQAKSLRAQAQRARLEAERMDAELTLTKIERLERQLKNAKTKGEAIEELQRQLDNLEAKLRGEPPKPVLPKEPSNTKVEQSRMASVTPRIQTTDLSPSPKSEEKTAMTLDLNDYLSSGSFEETKRIVDNSPNFLKKLLASMVEVDYDRGTDVNTTQLALRMLMVRDGDFSYSDLPKPSFTETQIEETIRRLNLGELSCPDNIVQKAAGDTRKMAIYVLETEYYFEKRLETESSFINIIQKAGEDEELLKGLINALNTTTMDQYITALYPKCTRKENAQEPTTAQIQSFFSNVLPKVKFTATSKPEKVLGGYIIPGSYSYEKGDDLIAAIDKELSKAGLADKMTVLLTEDFAAIAKAAESENLEMYMLNDEDENPMLYITAPDIVRDPQPVPLSLVSGLGFATSWYLSIYPFLLNPVLSQRVEEQLAVADAGMTYDLEWLTDLSVPLFFYFIGLQLLHEIGHRIAASTYNVSRS